MDLDDVARATPVLQNTDIGVGRSKVFFRNIADSSFDGATQSTASLYFDEVPLGYEAGTEPEPLRYGTGDFLDVSQGKYATFAARLGRHYRTLGVTLAGKNLLDTAANSFALGNPTTLVARQQTTPLRPRNLRVGFSIGL